METAAHKTQGFVDIPLSAVQLLDLLADGVGLFDKAGREIFSNRSYRKIRQCNADVLLPMGQWPTSIPSPTEPAQGLRTKALDGSYRYLSVIRDFVAKPIGDAGYWIEFVTEKTSKREAAKRLGIVKEYLIASDNCTAQDQLALNPFVDKSLTGILIFSSKRIHLVNKTFTAITGYDETDILAMSPWDMVHPDERAKIRSMAFKRFKKLDVQDYYETRWINKDGHEIWVEVRAVLLQAKAPTKIMANVVDITKRKIALDALKKREEDLQIQSRRLEETNIALRVIIKQRNEAVEELKNTIQLNVKKLIMPYLNELDGFYMKPRFKAYLETIKQNLEEIVAPIAGGALLDLKILTPKQLKVLNLIHCGRSSKEIAELLGVSKAAVDFHRNIIRKKLNLSRQVNLRTFLDLNDQPVVVQNT